VLFHTHEFGHGGVGGRLAAHDEAAFELAFLVKALGLPRR
jgi:protease II